MGSRVALGEGGGADGDMRYSSYIYLGLRVINRNRVCVDYFFIGENDYTSKTINI